MELIAHFDQRPAVEVERHERLSVEGREPAQTGVDLRAAFLLQNPDQRSLVLDREAVEDLGDVGGPWRPPHGPIQRHPVGHRPQPAAETPRIPQLTQLPQRPDKDLLAHLLRLAVIAQPPEDRAEHQRLELFDQPAKGLPIAVPGRADHLGPLVPFRQSHGKVHHKISGQKYFHGMRNLSPFGPADVVRQEQQRTSSGDQAVEPGHVAKYARS